MMGVVQIRLVILASIVCLWEFIAWSGWLYEEVFPSGYLVLTAAGHLLADAQFYTHLLVTLIEILVGLLISIVLGVATGLVLGVSQQLYRSMDPILVALATTPKIVFFPVIMLLVGIGTESKIAMGALSAYFPIALSSAASIRAVPQVLIDVGRALKLNRWQMARSIYVPAVVPELLTGVRLGLGVCIIGVLLAEIKMSNQGLGFMAIEYYNLFDIPSLYAALLVIFLIAIAINTVIDQVLRRVTAYRQG